MTRYKFILSLLVLNFLLFSQYSISHSLINDSPTNYLIISESTYDLELSNLIKTNLGDNCDITNINSSEDLNTLFLDNNYLINYDAILLIMDTIAKPFNESLTSDLSDFIDSGGSFLIISSQIWKFPSSFHDLLGISITTKISKEIPTGNNTTNINMTLNIEFINTFNDTFDGDVLLQFEGRLGAITSKSSANLGHFYTETNPTEEIEISLKVTNGSVITFPISLAQNDSFLEFSQFVSFLIIQDFSSLQSGNITDVSNSSSAPDTSDSSLITFTETTSNSDDFLLLPNLKITEETAILGAAVLSITSLGLLFPFAIKNYLQGKSNTLIANIPKDKNWLYRILTVPFFLIAHVVYPPVIRRISEDDVYDNDIRREIIDFLDEKDFLHFREIQRKLNIGISGLRWHLQVLEDFRVIDHQTFGKYEIYFLISNKPDSEELEIYFSIVSGIGFRIGKAFTDTQTWNLDHLAEYLGTSVEAARYHCKKMVDINLLRKNNGHYKLNQNKSIKLNKAINRRKFA